MRILRVEDSFGYGYKGNREEEGFSLDGFTHISLTNYTYTTYMTDSRPAPWQDGIPKSFLKRKGWYFGFCNEDQLTKWFSPYDLYLTSYFGGSVVEYEIDDKCVERKQSMCIL